MAVARLSLPAMISPDYRTVEAYTESKKRSAIGNTKLENAVAEANKVENRQEAYTTISSPELKCNNSAPLMEFTTYRGKQWIKFEGETIKNNPNQARIQVVNGDLVSLDRSNREPIKRRLYERFDLGENGWNQAAIEKESEKELVRIGLARLIVFNLEAWPSDQFHLFYAVLKAVLKSFDSKKHGDSVISALPWDSKEEDHERERERIVTAPLSKGVSTATSLASASILSQRSVDNDNAEGTSENRAGGDWGMPSPEELPFNFPHEMQEERPEWRVPLTQFTVSSDSRDPLKMPSPESLYTSSTYHSDRAGSAGRPPSSYNSSYPSPQQYYPITDEVESQFRNTTIEDDNRSQAPSSSRQRRRNHDSRHGERSRRTATTRNESARNYSEEFWEAKTVTEARAESPRFEEEFQLLKPGSSRYQKPGSDNRAWYKNVDNYGYGWKDLKPFKKDGKTLDMTPGDSDGFRFQRDAEAPDYNARASGQNVQSSSYPQTYDQPVASTSTSNYQEPSYDDGYDVSDEENQATSGPSGTYNLAYPFPQQTHQADPQIGIDELGTRVGQVRIEEDNRSEAPSPSHRGRKSHHSRGERSHHVVETQVFSDKNGAYVSHNGESKYLNQLTAEGFASLGRLYVAIGKGTKYVDKLTAEQRDSLGINLNPQSSSTGIQPRGTNDEQSGRSTAATSDAMTERTRKRIPLDWAKIQYDLGAAFFTRSKHKETTTHLEESVAACRATLEELSRERVPMEWAIAKNDLGMALFRLGEPEARRTHLEESVVAYRAALEELTRDRAPIHWAAIQHNLALALSTLGEREAGTTHLQESVVAYRAGLKELPRESVPVEWARAQNDLGMALFTLGGRETGTTHLQESVVAYRAGLEELSRERVPRQWAATQYNLGAALFTLGEREVGTMHLEESIAASRAALEAQPREHMPLDWAAAQHHLGLALLTLGEREVGTTHLEESITASRAALEERTRKRVPRQWAATQNQLNSALRLLKKRTRKS